MLWGIPSPKPTHTHASLISLFPQFRPQRKPKMSQCVPSWDLDDNPAPLKFTTSNSSSLDYGVAELTWQNGQLAMQGLHPPRVLSKPAAVASSGNAWEKPRAGGTLEAIVDQATAHPKSGGKDLVPWFDHRHVNPPASANVTMDALVPCNNNSSQEHSSHVLESVPGNGTCMVGSCSVAARKGRIVRPCCCTSVSESATCGGRDSRQVTLDSCEREFGGGGGLTSTSLWSPENTSSGQECTRTSGEDYDSICQSRSQREADEKCKKKGSGKFAISAKSRAAAIHNQSERKRRDKINQRMKTLQKLVPNSSKTDKASMLDEVIEYLKQLQAQIQMMSRMNMPAMNMMMPLPMHQQLQMSMMGMAGMGVMDINSMGRAAAASGMPPMIPTPSAAAAAFMAPMGSWDMQAGDRMHVPPVMPDMLSTFLACQSQPMTIDAYSRLQAAMYQQFQQHHAGSASKN